MNLILVGRGDEICGFDKGDFLFRHPEGCPQHHREIRHVRYHLTESVSPNAERAAANDVIQYTVNGVCRPSFVRFVGIAALANFTFGPAHEARGLQEQGLALPLFKIFGQFGEHAGSEPAKFVAGEHIGT